MMGLTPTLLPPVEVEGMVRVGGRSRVATAVGTRADPVAAPQNLNAPMELGCVKPSVQGNVLQMLFLAHVWKTGECATTSLCFPTAAKRPLSYGAVLMRGVLASP